MTQNSAGFNDHSIHDFSDIEIPADILALVPGEFARANNLIPLSRNGDILSVAMSNTTDITIFDKLQKITGCTIEALQANNDDINNAIIKYFPADSIQEEAKKEELHENSGEELSLEKMHDDADQQSIIKLVNAIITEAINEGASDIHINPEEKILRIRYRIDGTLIEKSFLPKSVQAPLISRIKIMAEMNIAIKRTPQDGKLRIKSDEVLADIRVSSFPTIHGENLVLRILDLNNVMLGMNQLGLYPDDLKQVKRLIARPHGILLISGPTGSGKTTTLYAILSEVNTVEKNIITVEDPVEYQIPLIRQSQINVKAGLTFATGLRAILRQDPDIVMVGEIRDKETAEISIQASLTGHLVFSTLHTNDSTGALTRLIDMGVEPFLVSSSVYGVLAQRLVRKLCSHCKEPYVPNEKLLSAIGVKDNGRINLYKPKGCEKCKSKGYSGRMGIYELLTMSEELRTLVLERQSSDVIKRAARKKGLRLLREDGIIKAIEGITSIEEVFRVTSEL